MVEYYFYIFDVSLLFIEVTGNFFRRKKFCMGKQILIQLLSALVIYLFFHHETFIENVIVIMVVVGSGFIIGISLIYQSKDS